MQHQQQLLRGAGAAPLLLQPPRPPPLQQPARPRRGRSVACWARRTVRGEADSRTGGGSPLKRPNPSSSGGRSSSSNSSTATKEPPRQRASNNAPPPRPPRRQQPSSSSSRLSRLEGFMRETPGLNRFLDGTLILGDAVMVLATEASSERLPLEAVVPLAGVAVASWVAAGAALGDYTAEPDPDANPLSDALGWPVFAAVVNAMVTWALSMVLSIGGFSWLVSSFMVEPEMVLEVARDGQLSPQLEISVALLITMSCWRGMAARLRL